MSGTSTKSTMISFRLSEATKCEIERLINGPASDVHSVSSYCKLAVERYVRRNQRQKRVLGQVPAQAR